MHRRLFQKPALTYRDFLERIPILDRTRDQLAYLEMYDTLAGFPDQVQPMMAALADWTVESR